MSRRTMFAPMRPSPIMPSCIASSLEGTLELAVTADQVVRRAVMGERGLRLVVDLRPAFEFQNDALGQHLAQLDAPLVEGVDAPDGALGENAVLVESDELAERLRRQP